MPARARKTFAASAWMRQVFVAGTNLDATVTALASTQEHYALPAGLGLAPPDQLVGKRLFAWNDGTGGEMAFAWDSLGNPANTSAGDVFTTNAEGNRLIAEAIGDSILSAPRLAAGPE